MANEQDQRNVDQFELFLSHSTRTQLITTLNDLSAILQCSETIPDDAKQRTSDKIDKSIHLLLELLPSESSQSVAGVSSNFEERIADRLLVGLSYKERMAVFEHLMASRNAVIFGSSTANEIQSSLQVENRRILHRLLDLPYRTQSRTMDDLRSTEYRNEKGEPISKKQRVESVIARPNEQLDSLRAVTVRQAEQIASLRARMDKETAELKRQIRQVDTSRAEASFRFELADVSKFFEVENNEHYSDRFWCRGLQWSLLAERRLKRRDLSKQLAFFLCCHNTERKWSCRVRYKLILFSSLQNRDFVEDFTDTFAEGESCGLSNFISYRELIDRQSGYLRNDKIVLGVEMNAEQVARVR